MENLLALVEKRYAEILATSGSHESETLPLALVALIKVLQDLYHAETEGASAHE